MMETTGHLRHLLAACGAALALAFGGCLSDADGGLDAPGAALRAFSAPVLVGIGGSTETSLALGSDGLTLLACSHGTFSQPSPTWLSRDGGLSWAKLQVAGNPVPSGDCDVAVADDGTLYVAYDTLASTTVAASRDGGDSWTVAPVAALPVTFPVDRPWLATAGEALYLTHKSANTNPLVLVFAKSTDHGQTWTDQAVIPMGASAEHPNGNVGKMVVADGGRTIHVPVHRFLTFAADLGQASMDWFDLVSSHDGGATWTTRPVAGPFAGTPSQFLPQMGRAEDGTLYWGFARPADQGADVLALVSRDDGATWSEPRPVGFIPDRARTGYVWTEGSLGSSAVLTWFHHDGTGWTNAVAHVDVAAEPFASVVARATPPGGTDSRAIEFVMAEVDAQGKALFAYHLAGPGCDDRPMFNGACIHFVREL